MDRTTFEIDEILRESAAIKRCLHPGAPTGCSEFSAAHTLSRAMDLNIIARDNHVYRMMSLSLITRIKAPNRAEPISVNKASAFYGFCNKHDTATFQPLDTRPFAATREQCFLTGYRAFSMEWYKKLCAIDGATKIEKYTKGMPFEERGALLYNAGQVKKGALLCLKYAKLDKRIYEDALLKRDFTQVNYLVWFFNEQPSILASVGIVPELDFDGNVLHDLADKSKSQDFMSVSLVHAGTMGAVVFTWVYDRRGDIERVVRSFHKLPNEKKGNAVVRFIFECCENTYVSPDWWDNLPVTKQRMLIDRMEDSSMIDGRRSDTIGDDGVHYVDWTHMETVSTIAL